MAEADETMAERAKPARSLAIGDQLGRFKLRRVLGEGGMGMVWAAHDPDLDREVAIKVLRHGSASDALRKRLLREGRAMARLKHPNVLTVHEVGTQGETDFIVMELVEGDTLDEWLTNAPPDNDVWNAVIAAGRGLAAAHAVGLVHRDFKPHNVLRSRDGRVLVTDFGLARGMGDEPIVEMPVATKVAALDVTVEARTPSRTDSLLDSPLTQTGMLIGTPAYMAPEQFRGADPDPRTDQFAFCVSAWQALAGARPFTGETLEQLLDATLRGVDGVIANIPKKLRAVLARGLAVKPEDRFADMNALLDALEVTREQRKKTNTGLVLVSMAVVLGSLFGLIGLYERRTKKERAAVRCPPAEQVFGDVWSDAEYNKLRRVLSGPSADRVARAFGQFRTKWIASYQEACNAPPTPKSDARLACLRGVRDEAITMRIVVNEAKQLDGIDVHGALPNLAACNIANPIAPPEIPTDQRRDVVLGVLARTMSLRAMTPAQLDDIVVKLVGDANASGWKPLVPIVQVFAGNAYLARGAYPKARELFRTAAKTAHVRFQALAHLGLLEASVRELESPGDDKELAREITYASNAIRAAGDDPILAASLAQLEAEAEAQAALWSRVKKPYKEAVELAIEARKTFQGAGDLRRASEAAAMHAWLLLWRGADGAVDDATFVVRSAQEAATAAGLDPVSSLEELRGRIAFAKGEYRDAHERFDRLPRNSNHLDGEARRGRVVDRTGTGVRATVVTWTGELHGDPVRLYTDPRFEGEVIETGVDGTFEFHAGDAIVAEAGTERCAPRTTAGDVRLVVEPVQESHGGVDGARLLVDAVARYAVGEATFYVHAPLAKDGSYQLGGLPKAPHAIGVLGQAGDATRWTTGSRLAWPAGRAIEAIVRAKEHDQAARIWIFRGVASPKTRADAEVLAAKSPDIAVAGFHSIGADASDAGRESYAAGDRHALVMDNAPGDVTICVSRIALSLSPVYCAVQHVTSDEEAVVPVLFKTDE